MAQKYSIEGRLIKAGDVVRRWDSFNGQPYGPEHEIAISKDGRLCLKDVKPLSEVNTPLTIIN